MIHIVGLGAGNFAQMTQETIALINTGLPLYLRTEIHPAVTGLIERELPFISFDNFYETEESFEEVYDRITEEILSLSEEKTEIIYAVPGHPLIGEKTVQGIKVECTEKKIPFKIYSGISFIDVVTTSLGIDPAQGLKIIDAFEIREILPDTKCGNLILQVYNRVIASEIKLALMEIYDGETPIQVIANAGIDEEEVVAEIPLYELDRQDFLNHLTSVYIPPVINNTRSFEKLVKIMATLRSENGCPWDREQNHETLKPYLIEETYEVLDAIDSGDYFNLEEELGDLLLQIVFHAQIGRDKKTFNIYDVIQGINDKMIRRHPHVFGEVDADNPDEVMKHWAAIKQEEKCTTTITEEMENIPKGMPSLLYAHKVEKKARRVGFDWNIPEQALEKVFEEAEEAKQAFANNDEENIREEIGDILFAASNLARLAGYQGELILKEATEKFIGRFAEMERLILSENRSFDEFSLEELEIYYQKAKKM
jgi:tetrapyrrole methylase family protein/MazG family protein